MPWFTQAEDINYKECHRIIRAFNVLKDKNDVEKMAEVANAFKVLGEIYKKHKIIK